jgi:hypothetical protein
MPRHPAIILLLNSSKEMETEYFLKLFMFFVGVGLLVEAVRWL